MRTYDHIIVGAGSAGCVLAERLSRSGRRQVLLLEAGSSGRDLLIDMPKGMGRLLGEARHVSHHPVGETDEVWRRGRTLGGSSAVNGMIYTRGDPADYDDWAAQGLAGWDWAAMGAAFQAIEDHALGPGPWRGVGGPLHVSRGEPHPVCDAFIESGRALGLPVKADLNSPDDQAAIGYCARTIWKGRRWSAADAFLKPALKRPNLTVITGVQVDRLLFDGSRAVGVAGRRDGAPFEASCGREVILAAGALGTPKILQLSGIGPADRLKAAGVAVRLDRPAVGAHLREHRVLFMQFRLARPELSRNRDLRGLGLAASALDYAFRRRGVLAQGAYEAGAFVRSRPGLARPDVQLLMAPFSLALEAGPRTRLEAEPGLQCITLPLRPTSEGRLGVVSADPDAPLQIEPNYLATEEDRASAVAGARFVRRLMAEPPLARLIVGETAPGAALESDAEILEAYRRGGSAGYHAVGVCRMGADEAAVTDARLQVRGVPGLRIVDCSAMPAIPSGNTSGPVMALAWRAADLILENDR